MMVMYEEARKVCSAWRSTGCKGPALLQESKARRESCFCMNCDGCCQRYFAIMQPIKISQVWRRCGDYPALGLCMPFSGA